MSNLITPIVVGLGVAVSAFPIVAVAGPTPAPRAARSAQDFGMPVDPAPAEGSPAAPPSSLSSPEGEAPASSRTVLLMKDGNVRILDGPAAEERLDYVISLDIGQIRIPKAQVEQRFGSLREAYEYQRDHLPDRDPDEHLRLARWCLTHGMPEEAAEQLRALLAWSPGDATAEAMLRNLSTAAANAARANRDAGVVRTGGDLGRGNEPRELDVSVLGQIRAYKGRIPPPVIFDLPEPLAVRRFQEYGQTVHRVLQVRCASCHDESSDRNFRLIRARDPKDLTNTMLVRTNLDATLGLVERTNPGHSPLLINAIMPHGPDQKAIIPNPNSPEYRALWSWVESLRADAPQQPAVATAPAPDPSAFPATMPMPMPMPGAYPPPQGYPPQGYPGQGYPQAMPADPSYGGGFATQRSGPIATAPGSIPAGPSFVPDPNATYERIERNAIHPGVPEDLDFRTVSPLLGSPEAASLTINGRAVHPPGASGQPSATPAAPAPGTAMPANAAAPSGGPTPPPGFILPPGVTLPGAPAGPAIAPAPAPAGASPMTQATAPAPPGVAPAPRPTSPGVAPAPAPAPAPRPAPDANGVVSLPDGTQILTQADGSKMMRLPDGELVPFFDQSAIDKAPVAPGRDGASRQIDPALLERLQRRRMGGGP